MLQLIMSGPGMRDMDGYHAGVSDSGSGTSAIRTNQKEIETFPIYLSREAFDEY